MSEVLTDAEREIAKHVTDNWRTFKEILWEVNGPRELTIQQSNVQRVLTHLCRRRILQSRAGTKIARSGHCGFASIPNGDRLYRRRPA